MPDDLSLLARFVQPNAALWLETHTDPQARYNRTPCSVNCYGNQAGFLTLASLLLVARNEYLPAFDLLSLGIASARDFDGFLIEVAPLQEQELVDQNVVERIDRGFSWKLGGKSACEFAGDIHGLGNSLGTSHRHLDGESYPYYRCSGDWSIYCEVLTADQLVSAAADGDLERVKFCLRLQIRLDDPEEAGELENGEFMIRPRRTPLTAAAEKGHASIVRLLLDKGAIADKPDGYGRTALAAAREFGHRDVIQLLDA